MSNAHPMAILPLKVVAGRGKEMLAASAGARAGRATLVEPRITPRPSKRADRDELVRLAAELNIAPVRGNA